MTNFKDLIDLHLTTKATGVFRADSYGNVYAVNTQKAGVK
jgi:hypothetical protein